MIRQIKFINKDNLNDILSLKVSHEQEAFIETTHQSLEEAKSYSNFIPVGLYADNVLVGFAMYGQFFEDTSDENTKSNNRQIWLDRILIDYRYQGLGHGKAFLELLIELLQTKYETNQIYLSVFHENKPAIKMYLNFGFRFNGEKDCGGEDVMVLETNSPIPTENKTALL